MTTVTADVPHRDPARDRALIRWWLLAVALLVVAMVLVGGATRLTDSGLSITEWKPIHGVIPPLSAAEWQEEFARYQQIPEYQVLNKGMSLEAFKGIFWWEWAHRFLGRVIGVVFLLPLVFFLVTGRIERRLGPQLVIVFVLGGLQGAIGWWMVASGLVERTDVSQYRLAVHLTFACLILAYILWIAVGLRPVRASAPPGLRLLGAAIVAVVFLQIFAGGLVAGLDAGLVTDEWPLINGALVPSGLLVQEPAWRNLFENALAVHFDHRLIAYLLLVLVAVQALVARGTPYLRRALTLLLLVGAQALLGIATVMAHVPLPLALLHQLGAIAVLAHAVANLRRMIATGDAPVAAPARP